MTPEEAQREIARWIGKEAFVLHDGCPVLTTITFAEHHYPSGKILLSFGFELEETLSIEKIIRIYNKLTQEIRSQFISLKHWLGKNIIFRASGNQDAPSKILTNAGRVASIAFIEGKPYLGIQGDVPRINLPDTDNLDPWDWRVIEVLS